MLFKREALSRSEHSGLGCRLASFTAVGFGLLLMCGTLSAEPRLSKREKSRVVANLNEVLTANYVFPDKANQIVAALEKKLRDGAYRSTKTRSEFARRLTEDLIEITGDLHFSVGVDPEWIKSTRAKNDPEVQRAAERAELTRIRRMNFGFESVKRLEGNVGYVRFDYFADPETGDETAAAAMRMVENTDALIFDLRYNRGGYMEMVQFLLSYLFATGEERLFFDYFYRENGKRIERGQWLLPALPGQRRPDLPVYVVMSSMSFSAAEWFAFVLQKLGRAAIIGEVSAGAAHSVDAKVIDDNFFVRTPIGVTRDPVDKGDFEGTGVKPDHDIIASKAVAFAHRMALKNLASANPGNKAEYDWIAPIVASRVAAPKTTHRDLQRAVGRYEGRRLSLIDGALYYHWRDRFRMALEPLTPTLFVGEGSPDLRLEVVLKAGRVTALKRVERDDKHRIYKRLD